VSFLPGKRKVLDTCKKRSGRKGKELTTELKKKGVYTPQERKKEAEGVFEGEKKNDINWSFHIREGGR